METELIGALVEKGLLGVLTIALAYTVFYLFKQLRASWEERIEAAEKQAELYSQMHMETYKSIQALAKLLKPKDDGG